MLFIPYDLFLIAMHQDKLRCIKFRLLHVFEFCSTLWNYCSGESFTYIRQIFKVRYSSRHESMSLEQWFHWLFLSLSLSLSLSQHLSLSVIALYMIFWFNSGRNDVSFLFIPNWSLNDLGSESVFFRSFLLFDHFSRFFPYMDCFGRSFQVTLLLHVYGVSSRICSKQHVSFSWFFYLHFSHTT